MGLAGTIVLVVVLIALRLLLPPAPGLLVFSRRWGKRTTILLCSISIVGAVVAILLLRH
jgi:hypothetical protein